jgi:hypothetical protein
VTSHMTGHVLEAREVTRSAFVSSGEPGFVTGRGLVRSDSHIEAWWAGAGHGVDTIEEDNAGVRV